MIGLQKRKKIYDFLFKLCLYLFSGIVALFLIVVILFLIIKGSKVINLEFLISSPKDSMTKGGIFPCIIGTVILAVGSTLIALPIGIITAVYMSEYAKPGKILNVIRFGVNTLAGVPSVVFGLFGLALFVIILHFGVSILSGCLTLAALILPIIIASTEEALRAVPDTYREASLALGATKFQTTFRVVLPAAFPGILTGTILSLARAAGETAPIMFTAAVFFKPSLPTSIFDSIMALPYHIYVLASAGIDVEKTRPIQYGTALVLIVLVLGLNLIAIILRAKLQRRR